MGLGGEADQHLAGAGGGPPGRPGCRASARGRARAARPPWSASCSAGALGRKSATAAAMTTTSAARRRCQHRRLHLGRRLDVDPRHAGRHVGGEGEGRDGDQGHGGPPPGGRLGHGVALLARRAVGQEAHRVEGLAGPAGAHDHVRARARSRRAAAAPSAQDRVGDPPGSASRPAPPSPPARRPALGRHDRPPAARASPGCPARRRAPTSRCAWPGRPAPGPAWPAGWRSAGRRESGGVASEEVGRGRSHDDEVGALPSLVWGMGEASSHSVRCTGSEARAEKVTSPTKRVASSVSTGATWTPASTRRRQTSTAL